MDYAVQDKNAFKHSHIRPSASPSACVSVHLSVIRRISSQEPLDAC
jgi:hypothetical protein